MKLIDISTPKYPDTFTMVDDADFDWLNQWKWAKSHKGYAVRVTNKNGKCCKFIMHREILNPPPGMFVDHRFGDTLDNRRQNLRLCTNAENARNRKQRSGRALPKGVDWLPKRGRFQARIMVDYKSIHIGHFFTESEAEAAYDAAATKYFGEFARTNKNITEQMKEGV